MLEIRLLKPGDDLWEETARFARECSWRAGPFLAAQMEEKAFLDWERVILALSDGSMAGFCTFTEKDELPGEYVYTPFIGFVFVHEAFRGKRISEKMIQAALRYAQSLGYEDVYMMSGEQGLYEKYGFEKIGVLRTVQGTYDQLFVRSVREISG